MTNHSLPGSPLPNEDMEAMLWAYIDGLGTQASVVKSLIENDAEWKMKYAELLAVHQLIAASELEQPSMRFTKNVMDEIARYQVAPAAKKYINTKIIWGIAAFFITVITGVLVYGFSQINWSAAGSSSATFGFDLGAVNYSKIFGNSVMNGFMMINILLALLLLERYLSARAKKIRQIR